jgi:hypothetical protein
MISSIIPELVVISVDATKQHWRNDGPDNALAGARLEDKSSWECGIVERKETYVYHGSTREKERTSTL